MKRVVLLISIVLLCIISFAQVPETFSYQAIVRDGGVVLSNQSVSYQFSIIKGVALTDVIYTEKHSVETNQFGLVNLAIGNGTDKTGDFSTIDWGADDYFLKVEIDITGVGTDYTDMGTTQLLTVPYAMYAKTAGTSLSTSFNDLTNVPVNLDTDGTDDFNGSFSSLSGVPAGLSDGDDNTQLSEAQVDTYVSNNSYLTTEVDGSVSNEIQDISSVLTHGNDANNNAIVNLSQQGIGTSTPNSSASLEISSTTTGFLPPRMTQEQRDAITPVEGLIVYNTTTKKPNYYDGSEWENYDGTSAKTLAVGVSHQGGIIAYILQSGDPGYIEGEIHGLIAAPSDQSTLMEFGCYNIPVQPCSTDIGTGETNTIYCLVCAAANLCNTLILDDYDDWFLPSILELDKLYLNKEVIGGFEDYYYWSSSSISATSVWAQNFGNGNMEQLLKFANTGYVRAIRAF